MIKLTDNLAIVADEHQYIVGKPRHKTDKAGKVITVIDKPTYHTSLSTALKSAVAHAMREKVAEGTVTTLRGYLDELKQVQADFAALLKPMEV